MSNKSSRYEIHNLVTSTVASYDALTPVALRLVKRGRLVIHDYVLRTIYSKDGCTDMDDFGSAVDMNDFSYLILSMDCVVSGIKFDSLIAKVNSAPKFWAYKYHDE